MQHDKQKSIALCQLTSSDNLEENYQRVENLVAQAMYDSPQMIFLPECFAMMGTTDGENARIAEPLTGPWMQRYCALAKKYQVWCSLGGFPESSGGSKCFNSHVIVDDHGQIVDVYRKIHLYDATLASGQVYAESASTLSGNDIKVVATPIGRLGLAVCYDVRFPELFRAMRAREAEVIAVPAAFTMTTGKDHWEPLLRARAIENQCYIIAAAQWGKHNEKRLTYGHSMVVDPWGMIGAQVSDGEGFTISRIRLEYVHTIRERMPVWEHRKIY